MSRGRRATRILPRSYYRRPTLKVAMGLLGNYLVRNSKRGTLSGRIVEVEAYVGPEDRASHASRGRTPRTEVMFGRPGLAYVYLVYGMYYCFNIVTERIGYPAAVLVRAVDQIGGSAARPRGTDPTVLNGPGRVCRFFQIDRSLNQLDLTLGDTLWIEDRGARVPPEAIVAYPRIGVDYAGEWATKLWRFRLARTGDVRRAGQHSRG